MAVEVRSSYGAGLLVCFLVVFAFGIPGSTNGSGQCEQMLVNVVWPGEGEGRKRMKDVDKEWMLNSSALVEIGGMEV